ncbi:hypothetical protein [Candidatus Nitrosotenuis cloacae]|uniref:hypothetical protein n=1 Tax=Candidatus Nitrosotenuis cloacae TaxID=1603555 RepID=UPI00228066CD|nr:hypothetical protein [Candidatus Nitrosotenuis cloacae]
MRIDCCRSCGNTLEVRKYCEVCSQPIQFICSECFHFADDPTHSECERKDQINNSSLA